MGKKEKKIGYEKQAELYWEEWKYRHEVYWKSVNLWGGAIILLLVGPYTDVVNQADLGEFILIFPALAFLMSLFSGWQLSAEYVRTCNAWISLRNVLPIHRVEPKTFKEKVQFYSIGKFVTRVFVIGLSALSVIDFFILSKWLK
jgi:hypothetical protein